MNRNPTSTRAHLESLVLTQRVQALSVWLSPLIPENSTSSSSSSSSSSSPSPSSSSSIQLNEHTTALGLFRALRQHNLFPRLADALTPRCIPAAFCRAVLSRPHALPARYADILHIALASVAALPLHAKPPVAPFEAHDLARVFQHLQDQQAAQDDARPVIIPLRKVVDYLNYIRIHYPDLRPLVAAQEQSSPRQSAAIQTSIAQQGQNAASQATASQSAQPAKPLIQPVVKPVLQSNASYSIPSSSSSSSSSNTTTPSSPVGIPPTLFDAYQSRKLEKTRSQLRLIESNAVPSVPPISLIPDSLPHASTVRTPSPLLPSPRQDASISSSDTSSHPTSSSDSSSSDSSSSPSSNISSDPSIARAHAPMNRSCSISRFNLLQFQMRSFLSSTSAASSPSIDSSPAASSPDSSWDDSQDWFVQPPPLLPPPPPLLLSTQQQQQQDHADDPTSSFSASTRCPQFQRPRDPSDPRCLDCGCVSAAHAHESAGRFTIPFAELVLERLLWRGSCASVFAGRWLYGGAVAVKCYADLSCVQDFRREVVGLSMIRHPNVLLFIGACMPQSSSTTTTSSSSTTTTTSSSTTTTPNALSSASSASIFASLQPKCVMVTELCQSDVPAFLAEHPLTSLDARLQMAVDAVLGMGYLHSLDLVHCGLTSRSLLVRPTGVVVVGDLGSSCPDLTPTGQVGSPGYMAPELALGSCAAECSFPCDSFSFGVVMYEVFAGERAWPDAYYEDAAQYARALARDERPHVARHLYMPAGLRALIARAWHRDPRRRPSFGEMLESLLKIKNHTACPTRTKSLLNIHLDV